MASCVPIKTPADVVVVLMMLRRINKPKLQNKPIKVDQPHNYTSEETKKQLTSKIGTVFNYFIYK
jgi:hypothetical protein